MSIGSWRSSSCREQGPSSSRKKRSRSIASAVPAPNQSVAPGPSFSVEKVVQVAGDFFDAVPRGADAYLLSNVLWNWDDDDAVRLLRAVRDAASSGARLIVLESVLPELPGFHRAMRVDVINLMMFGGRCRTLAEHDGLLAAAGFERRSFRESTLAFGLIDAVAA
jgi:hypothetical protein